MSAGLQKALDILDDYSKKDSTIDNGNLFYAANVLKSELLKAVESSSKLVNERWREKYYDKCEELNKAESELARVTADANKYTKRNLELMQENARLKEEFEFQKSETEGLKILMSTLNKYVFPGEVDSGDSARMVAEENIRLREELAKVRSENNGVEKN